MIVAGDFNCALTPCNKICGSDVNMKNDVISEIRNLCTCYRMFGGPSTFINNLHGPLLLMTASRYLHPITLRLGHLNNFIQNLCTTPFTKFVFKLIYLQLRTRKPNMGCFHAEHFVLQFCFTIK